MKSLLKNYSRGTEIAIDGTGPPREYNRWPKIVDDIGLMNLSKISPPVLPLALSTVVANDVSKLSMINVSGGIYFQDFSLLFPGGTNFGAKLVPVPETIILSWEFMLLCGLGSLYLKTVQCCAILIPVFTIIATPIDSPFLTNILEGILSLVVVSLSRTSLSVPGIGAVNLGNAK